MLASILLLIFSLVLILLSAELFTNGIEWVGSKLNMTTGAVGSILAAIGTALPETIIPILAIFFAKDKQAGDEISTGAILGAPLMLSTIALGVVGISIFVFHKMGKRASAMAQIDNEHMRRDLLFFLMAFGVAVSAAFLPTMPFRWVAVVFLAGVYAVYIYQVLQHPGEGVEDMAPLYMSRRKTDDHPMVLIVTQVVIALAVMILGAKLFVHQVEHLAKELSFPALILSLIITPLATELPEKFNSVIWLKANKDTLAIGNITGAMVFQSSVIPIVGILLTDWRFGKIEMVSVALTFLSALFVLLALGKKDKLPYWVFALGVLFYVAFIIHVI